MLQIDPQDKTHLIDSLFRTGPRFWVAALALAAIVGWGAAMYARQMLLGLAVTGMNRPNYWGIYIVNFIFLIGVSMAGTVITAALYLTGVNWRRPIARIAEATTVFGLMIAGLQVIVDMGRPERMLSMFIYGRAQSPLLWDVASLTLYLLTSSFALYISLMPDLGILRDNLPEAAPRWRRLLYTVLALGWRGNREQWRRLERVIRVVSILIIPIGVSLHTVTSWILSTTLQPGWHSTILGPYFVVGAIFSGIALLFILVTIVRQVSSVKFYIEPRHYRNLGWLFITMSIIWFYFTYTEHLTMIAGQDTVEFPLLASKLWGQDAPSFWGMVLLMALAAYLLISPLLLPVRWERALFFRPRFALATAASAGLALVMAYAPQTQAVVAGPGLPDLPAALRVTAIALLLAAAISILAWLRRHVVGGAVIASVAVVVGMWLERWNIIIPTVTHPRLIAWAAYTPTLTEWSLTAASAALFGLMLLVFFKLFPAVSLWEVAEGRVIDAAQAAIEIPLPPESGQPKWQRRGIRKRLA
jgi:molybdopterin-containing oxidoreductase family membrane subunit